MAIHGQLCRRYKGHSCLKWMRVYYAMTTNLDRNIGRLLQAVDDLGLRDDTHLCFHLRSR